ncbi:TPA: hypothetical protein KEW36_000082 [Proteus mirabilis]|uniref:hypothetical protein n=2 Tax=Morganellaceae TaxID=1903414 RepID=UPI001B9034AC|nr:hypothetical protein [Proteus mirabilis]EKU4145991.1 hypothetical protein [Proteus mirabilis]UTA59253.1 hypothetical protein J3U92_08295 [Proteus mirabilis]UTA62554.1 hypothetical protein J3U93_08310 [Proteus mirabilis]UTA65885.1 hypothetical protein J3U94_08320 [Proteus mirabilis]HBC6257678.1 hypothetical protein [Proteus mirabilis]
MSIFKKMSIEIMQIRMLTNAAPEQLEHLTRVHHGYSVYMDEQAKVFKQEIIDDPSYSNEEKDLQLSFIDDELYNSASIKNLLDELAIIGLYKTIEIKIKKIAKLSNLFTDSEIKNFYRYDNLKASFKDKGIDLNKIDYSSEYNELRLICNCLKHSGVVDDKLSEFDSKKWVKDTEITDSKAIFEKLLSPSLFFLHNLGMDLTNLMIKNNPK